MYSRLSSQPSEVEMPDLVSAQGVQKPANRRRVLMLVPHEPTLDPRVDHTAATLATVFDVTVLGVVRACEFRPVDSRSEEAKHYKTVRIPYGKGGAFRSYFAFMEIWLRQLFHNSALGFVAGLAVWGVISALLGSLFILFLVAYACFEIALLIIYAPFFVVRGVLHSKSFVLLPRFLVKVADSIPSRLLQRHNKPGPAIGFVRGFAHTLQTYVWYVLKTNDCFLRHLKDAGEKFDIVYCHDLYSLQTGVVLKRQHGVKLVYDSHEYYPYVYPDPFHVNLTRFYESVLVKAVDCYVTVSPQLARELEKTYAVKDIRVVPNVDPFLKRRPAHQETELSKLAAGRVKILYQGVFADGRGLEEVIEEWKSVDGSCAALFLRGPRNGVLDQIELQARRHGLLGQSIYILPPVLERDLIGAAQEADIGLVPYKGGQPGYLFACPNKLSQYLHAGLAVLASRIPYVEEVITRGCVGCCYDAQDKGSFANSVNLLTRDRSLLEKFKTNALVFSEKEYNWERYEDMLLKLVGAAG
jgi:glycosyltransferase involved in cell wall biosynthesis